MRVTHQAPLDKLKAPIQAVTERACVMLLRVCVFVRGVLPWA